ncbi:MAG TPA: RDD family protein [Solirubrobacteraceae bacterium]|nr:RDD family protein [Solirubrobacteraceae bacterium]
MQYEDRITIATPEGVSLELTLAGLGSRALAGGIDLLLKAILVGLLLAVLLAALGIDGALVILPAAGLTMLLYDVAFETLARGRTPGKRAVGLRVVRSDGRAVDFTASMIRNILRLVDGLPLSYVPTMVSIVLTRRNQRLGDLAADTVVIRDRRAVDRAHRGLARGGPASDAGGATPGAGAAGASAGPATAGGSGASWDVSAVPADDVAAVRSFLERRHELATEPRARLAAQLDGALRPRVGGADESDPERFLEILYDAKRARG